MENLYEKQKCDRSKYKIKLMTYDKTTEVYIDKYDIILYLYLYLYLYYNEKCISSVIGRYNPNNKWDT